MSVSGQEIATLDFANLIGGPLNAVVEAQGKAAITTANFIKEVGFDDKGKVISLDFSYTKTNGDGRKQDFELQVPLLAMLPIPYIKIKQADIKFNAKITSNTEATSSSVVDASAKMKAKGRWWFSKARVTSKSSYQSNTASSDSEQRTFDMKVHVKATGCDMPEGTARILNMLQNAMGEVAEDVKPIEIFVSKEMSANSMEYKIESGEFEHIVSTMKLSAKDDMSNPIVISSVNTNDRTITLASSVSLQEKYYIN